MKDFLLNFSRNTFNKSESKLILTRSSLEYLQQKIRAVLSFQKGEYFTDSEIGIPYIPDFDLGKVEHRSLVSSVIQQKVMTVDGIKKLLNFSTEYDSHIRKLYVSFTVQTEDGQEIVFDKEIIQ